MNIYMLGLRELLGNHSKGLTMTEEQEKQLTKDLEREDHEPLSQDSIDAWVDRLRDAQGKPPLRRG